MSSSKRQSMIMTGVGLILLSALILYFALSQPNVSDEVYIESSTSFAETETVTVTQSVLQENTASSEIEQTVQTVSEEYNADKTVTSAADYSQTQPGSAFNGKINLNTCTASDLIVLDGIGEARADAIIQYREYLGGYTSIDQIKNIKGIGDKLYEKIAPYLTV